MMSKPSVGFTWNGSVISSQVCGSFREGSLNVGEKLYQNPSLVLLGIGINDFVANMWSLNVGEKIISKSFADFTWNRYQ
ncbi:hypothetical protein PUN28_020262 [Cardiocondyla obscurior]|uniref:GDSL esterase/lipase n=1 Tax=Cardiocondyla obscurior TaxID=286306 RepID=A0AAW2EBP0_9HYME